MKHVYTSIDIGSDSIKVVVCELFNNKLNLLAATSLKSKGIKKGLITDGYEAAETVKKAINEVEEMLGINIKKVLTSVPSYFVDFKMVNGSIEIDKEVGVFGKDIAAVLQAAIKGNEITNKEVVNILPIDFSIDDNENVKDPKGLTGNVLNTRSIMVSTPKKNVYSVVSLLESIGLEVVDISLNSIGDIHIFRTKETENQIGAIVNIGYETTSISLYNKGIIVKNSIIGLGGKNIDNDISYIYKLDSHEAIKVKEKFALAHKKFASKNDFYEATNKLDEKIKINQFEISEVVMSRLEEILVLARKEINILTKREVDYIIITGGTSSMDNFSIIAEEVLGKLTTIGDIKILGVRNNKYSSAIGNIICFINRLKLKSTDYTMISKNDMEELSNNKNKIMNVLNDTMLGKVFGYFFND